jgi:hypothetical protein
MLLAGDGFRPKADMRIITDAALVERMSDHIGELPCPLPIGSAQ